MKSCNKRSFESLEEKNPNGQLVWRVSRSPRVALCVHEIVNHSHENHKLEVYLEFLAAFRCNEREQWTRLINHVAVDTDLWTHSRNSVAWWREQFDHDQGWVLWSSIRDMMFCLCVELPRNFSHLLSSSWGMFNLQRDEITHDGGSWRVAARNLRPSAYAHAPSMFILNWYVLLVRTLSITNLCHKNSIYINSRRLRLDQHWCKSNKRIGLAFNSFLDFSLKSWRNAHKKFYGDHGFPIWERVVGSNKIMNG